MTELSQLFREGMVLLSVVGAPLLGGLLVVGLGMGVLQSATQIQEPSVGAVPRLATIIGLSVVLGPWVVERLARFLSSSMERMSGLP
ncbi:MAG: flagellar biosynthetic protein FliQ [Myxococcaceae bacterium]